MVVMVTRGHMGHIQAVRHQVKTNIIPHNLTFKLHTCIYGIVDNKKWYVRNIL